MSDAEHTYFERNLLWADINRDCNIFFGALVLLGGLVEASLNLPAMIIDKAPVNGDTPVIIPISSLLNPSESM